ncbi:Crp/Fnr family transcriptional regulator [Nitrosomonas sp.]|uniref:Crp/Fnr family transcriptional regulator n=1 Tax=Nitrosomonas sp. TaxID=42353 RepID=UPI00284796B1|nr:Crp/Fnr family transcriptional regulator [Nitrosomonas sp.]MDR4513250.1 Crp/Fnr family transcriptional regulator [Nitrosomonas sp.]
MKTANLIDNELLSKDIPPLIRKFNFVQPLNMEETKALMRMHNKSHFIDESTVFLNYGDIHKKCYILTQGWAYRFNDLSNGSRQIINFYLPGDIISPFAVVMPRTTYSVASITRLEVSEFNPEYLIELIATQPKLGLLYGWLLGREDSIVAEQVVRVGRRSAYKRTAHLLLELYHRLKIIGETENNAFSMPLAQHFLADTLGLSLVHMNRTLKKLRLDKLINATSYEIILLDIDKLKEIAEYEAYYLEQIKNLSMIIENHTVSSNHQTPSVA